MIKHLSRSGRVFFCAALIALCAALCFAAPDSAHAATRNTDVAKASQGNVLVGVNGTFSSPSKATILKRINQIRKEAYTEGLVNAYVPIKWSSDLEWIAQTRAAEGSICWDHTRPNGDICFSATHNNVQTWGENLAWNGGDLMNGIELWYAEKYDYVHKTGNETGHYLSLIDPDFGYIGVGAFTPSGDGWGCVAAEFSFEDGLAEDKIGVTGSYVQKIEVPKSSIRGVKMTKKTRMTYGTSARLSTRVVVRFSDYWGGTSDFRLMFANKPTWTCSNSRLTKTAQSTYTATFKAAKIGPCKVTLKDSVTGKSTSQIITVVPKGTKVGTLSPKRGALGVSWTKQTTQTTGYQIAYKYAGSSWKYKKVSASRSSATLTNLKRGTTYAVKIRTYKTVNGKNYCSPWSSAKKAVTK